MTTTTKIAELTAALPLLGDRDQKFAASLIAASLLPRGLSVGQAPWVEKLLERAAGGQPERKTADVGTMSGVLALFDHAAPRLKRPAIVIGVAGSPVVRLTVATAKAQVPGSINVVEELGEKRWLGRILRDGTFEASHKHAPTAELVTGLQAFAADPAKVAGEYGRLTGRCCFCNIALTDGRSTGVGYGPTCADNYGLAWGAATAHKFATTVATAPAALPVTASPETAPTAAPRRPRQAKTGRNHGVPTIDF